MNKNEEPNEPDRSVSDRKIGDRALILPLVGCLLLIPPLAGIFQIDLRVFGIPFTAFYLFFVWGALIVGAAFLSRQIQRSTAWEETKPEGRGDRPDDAE